MKCDEKCAKLNYGNTDGTTDIGDYVNSILDSVLPRFFRGLFKNKYQLLVIHRVFFVQDKKRNILLSKAKIVMSRQKDEA